MEKIKRVRSVKDTIISLLFIIAGAVCCFFGIVSLLIFGVIILIFGIILLFVLKSEFVIEGINGRFTRKTYNFQNNVKDKVLAFIEGKGELPAAGDTGSLLLYVYVNKDSSESYAMLLEYSSYEYKPCGELTKLK